MLKFTYIETSWFVGYEYHWSMITKTGKKINFKNKDRSWWRDGVWIDGYQAIIRDFEERTIVVDDCAYIPQELTLIRKNAFKKKCCTKKRYGINKQDIDVYFGDDEAIKDIKNET